MEIIREYTSDCTQLAHEGDLSYWQGWLQATGFKLRDYITVDHIITFIVQHTEGLPKEVDESLVLSGHKKKEGTHALSTVKRRIASLSVFLDKSELPNVCQDKSVKSLLSKLVKKYGISQPAGKAITKDILDDMLATCKESPIDIRDKALLLFAWSSGGRRRSEITAAQFSHITFTHEQDFIYRLPKSKTDQSSKGYYVPIKGRAARALIEWIQHIPVHEGYLFRSIGKNGRVKEALADLDIYRIVQKRLHLAGYNEKDFCAHSLRSGFVTEAGRQGKQLGDVMALTTHKSVSTVMKYYQAGNITRNSASNLAD